MLEVNGRNYRGKVEGVIAYVQANLDQDLSLDNLSAVACLSKFHLHRLFTAFANISLAKFIQMTRLRRASQQLVYAPSMSITDIAFDAGFENAESFSRAFKKAFDQRPSDFRSQPNWQPWRQSFTLSVFQGRSDMQVNIVDFKETLIAALEHRGDHNLLHQTLNKFIAWRKTTKFRPDTSATYNIVYGDPNSTEPDEFRMDVAVAVDQPVQASDYGILNKVIPSGRCAVLRHLGSSDNIEDSALYLYREWLPESGESLRDFPCFFHRVVLHPEHEQITDIYLPIE